MSSAGRAPRDLTRRGPVLFRRFRRHGLAFAALVILAACPSGDHDPPADLIVDPGELVERLEAVALPETAAIEARATQYSEARVIKGRLTILVEQPASLHFAGLSPTDDVVSVLATDGKRFTSFERGAKVCYTGRACPENVGRLVPIALESGELAGALLGRPPLIDHGERSVVWDRRTGAYLLELVGARGVVQRLWVSHGRGEVRRAQLVDDGRVTVDLGYDDFADVGGHRLPRRLDVKMTRGDVDLRLIYRDIELGLEIDPAAFGVPCPVGTEVRVLACDDEPPPGAGDHDLAPETPDGATTAPGASDSGEGP